MSSQLDRSYLAKMRDDWNARARRNAEHYIADGQIQWDTDEFLASGRTTAAQDILTDMGNICRGVDPKNIRVLELGCGIGRVTRALAEIFGSVQGVDVSPEMISRAKVALEALPNIKVDVIDGATLESIGAARFDFAYSCCVFHHISSYEVIRSLTAEIGERLEPGSLFKFEVQGCMDVQSPLKDTWLGVPFSLQQAQQLADETGFELRYHVGEGEERFWLWFFRK